MDKTSQLSEISLQTYSDNSTNPGSTEHIVSNAGSPEIDAKRAKFLGWKNALALSFGWLFLYGGYVPISAIQNSLNGDKGLGTVSLSVQNACELIGNLFISNLIIYKIGNKWTICIGAFLFSAFVAANFYPTWGSLVPTAALAGLGSSMTWIAQNTYLTKLSQYYVQRTGGDYDAVNSRFFGTFYAIYYSCNVLGNVASSLLLGAMGFDSSNSNETLPYDPMELCGADYCNQDLGTYFRPEEELGLLAGSNVTVQSNSNRPELAKIYAMCGFCLASTLVGTLLMILFVDNLPKLGISEEIGDASSALQIVGATFRQLKDPNLLLLLPLTFYNGLDNDFFTSEFSKSFVTCPFGVQFIGFVSACYGILGPISALVSGWISTKRTQYVPFIVAGAAHIGSAVAMLYWKPAVGQTVYVYVMAAVWGIGTGVWGSQLNAYYGVVFPHNLEVAFSNYHLWNSLASTILYATSHNLCTLPKIYIMISIVSLGLIGMALVGIRRRRSKKNEKSQTKL